jgi:hypothetical protein
VVAVTLNEFDATFNETIQSLTSQHVILQQSQIYKLSNNLIAGSIFGENGFFSGF